MAACLIISPFSVATESLPGGTHFVVDNVRLAPLSDEHKSRIVDYLDKLEEDLLSKQVRSKPAFVVPYSEVNFLKGIGDPSERNALSLQIHRFSLEYFAGRSTPMAAFSYDGSEVIAHGVDADGLRFREADAVALEPGAWEKHAAYLKFAYPSIAAAPAAEIVVGRICRALREGPNADGLIDLAIALESLAEAKVEIKYQFSLFNSLIYSSDPSQRKANFLLLQSLYDVRSATVHGSKLGRSDKAKLTAVKDQWGSLISLARTNLTYYIEFCRAHSAKEWGEHVKGLAFGLPRNEFGQ